MLKVLTPAPLPLRRASDPGAFRAVAAMRRAALVTCAVLGLAAGGAHAGSYDDALAAARLGDARALASLLDRGIDPDTVDAQGNTLLILAAREGQRGAVDTLLARRVRIDYRNLAGDSALMLAVLRGHDDVVRALLQAGAKVNHEGWAPLHYAAFEGREALVDALVAAGAEVNAPAPNQATALALAARNGHRGVVRRLLALPQTELNALTDTGLSADVWAEQQGNTDIAALIRAERQRRGLPAPALRIRVE